MKKLTTHALLVLLVASTAGIMHGYWGDYGYGPYGDGGYYGGYGYDGYYDGGGAAVADFAGGAMGLIGGAIVAKEAGKAAKEDIEEEADITAEENQALKSKNKKLQKKLQESGTTKKAAPAAAQSK